jgi:hypothetical protein
MAVEFTTFSDLRILTNDLTLNEQSTPRSTASAKSSKVTFLSHSSKDTEYLPGVIQLLTNHGASVYCNLEDERMLGEPNVETAKLIKRQINTSRKLVTCGVTHKSATFRFAQRIIYHQVYRSTC